MQKTRCGTNSAQESINFPFCLDEFRQNTRSALKKIPPTHSVNDKFLLLTAKEGSRNQYRSRHSLQNRISKAGSVALCILVVYLAGYYAGGQKEAANDQGKKFRPGASMPDITIPVCELIKVPGGTFRMGDAIDGMKDAKPIQVTLAPFRVSKFEITLALWESVRLWARQRGYDDLPEGIGKADNHPVCGVSWPDAIKWCNAFSESQGLTPCYYSDPKKLNVARKGTADLGNKHVDWQATGFRLPTEAEWEFASRGGLEGKRFPWGDQITPEDANYHATGIEDYDKSLQKGSSAMVAGPPPLTCAVGSFPANDFGIHDMAGNVAEWCWDFYSSGHDGAAQIPIENPHGPDKGSDCVVRGGSWRHPATEARCASRFSMPGLMSAPFVGFRVVRGR